MVILAAGYDTRAWRLAGNAVRFIELDHPNTQNRKRLLAPSGGPVFVSADLTQKPMEETLAKSGFNFGQPAIFTCEGLTMYIDEACVRDLLSQIARISRPGSRLGVDFGNAPQPQQRLWRIAFWINKALTEKGGEPVRFHLDPRVAPRFLEETGWKQPEVLTGPELYDRFLRDTDLPEPLTTPGAYVVSATIPSAL